MFNVCLVLLTLLAMFQSATRYSCLLLSIFCYFYIGSVYNINNSFANYLYNDSNRLKRIRKLPETGDLSDIFL